MLTIPLGTDQSADRVAPAPATAVLIIGRSENVLAETAELLRADGYSVGATNDYANVLSNFDPRLVDIVVFGGQVPPDTKEGLRTRLRSANPQLTFVQGLAGIPGLIVAQVQAVTPRAARESGDVSYNSDQRQLTLSLESAQRVRLTGFWVTSFEPPEPTSTSELILDETLEPGTHTISLPASFPRIGSFVGVLVGSRSLPFAVGPMPVIAPLPQPS